MHKRQYLQIYRPVWVAVAVFIAFSVGLGAGEAHAQQAFDLGEPMGLSCRERLASARTAFQNRCADKFTGLSHTSSCDEACKNDAELSSSSTCLADCNKCVGFLKVVANNQECEQTK
ncbi:MAG: hypothetical protein B7Y80_21205 [Hyphomicrobium sp. 32-62-53]|nr:MAG: hypothetical protein B7Z29_21110 [Hyphomicrobium sp. 12-62-95]OYX97009.1 MAG: hypothetical protein B7Y80_21205 [Hyphomicrobium sp. 32-62-53]